jgi:hypothetical protein
MIHPIITCLVLLLILAAAWAFISKRRVVNRGRSIDLANNALIVNITPKGRATAIGDVAFQSRYLIAKRGAYEYSIAIAGQGDIPYGVVPDMTPTTDSQSPGGSDYNLPVNIFGLNQDTERVIASGAINIDDLVTTDAAGQVRSITPLPPGTYWVIGKAKTATVAQGDQLELIPAFPYQKTIDIQA